MTFTKQGDMKYTSHLDMVRLFKRAFRRSGIALAYSHGFNPHPRLSLCIPLSLGYTSLGELLEFETRQEWRTPEIGEKLGQQLPRGMAVLECLRLPDTGKSVASRICAAEYLIGFPAMKKNEYGSLSQLSEEEKMRCGEKAGSLAEDFLSGKEIMVKRQAGKSLRKKKGQQCTVDIDIRPMIEYVNMNIVDDKIIISTKIAAGSKSSLNPELFLEAFLEASGLDTDRQKIEILRTELFTEA